MVTFEPNDALQRAAASFNDAGLIVLFGSLARGEATPWSDADIGISRASFWRGLEIGAILGRLLDREAHVLDLDGASDWVRFQVATEGILLSEGAPDAWARFKAEAALRWFDVRPLMERCAEGVRDRLRQDLRARIPGSS